jgi:hypothetical protein
VSDVEYIPSNPPINSARINESRVINTTLSLRDRRQEPVVIPPPPVDEKVEVQKAQRRHFEQPTQYAQDQVFRRTQR